MNEERQFEIVQHYADCFIELCDLNALVCVEYSLHQIDVNDSDRVKEAINELGSSFGTNEMLFRIKGYDRWDSKYKNNDKTLRTIYEYLKVNLKDDEYRFSKVSNVKIENLYTRITVQTAGDNYVNSFNRDMKHPSIISSSYTGGVMTDYTIDPTNKPKLFLTSGRSIVRKIKSFIHGNTYNFPDIHPGDKIFDIQILHKISSLK